VLAAALLAGLAFWTMLALGLHWSPIGWDARLAHRGSGAFATYLATVAPFVMLLVWPPPGGMNTGPRFSLAALALCALVLIGARLSDARILWIALAAAVAITAFCSGRRASGRTTAAAVVLVLLAALLFVDMAHDRAQLYPAATSIGDTLASDPRLAIWKRSLELIRQHPWLGNGYGLHILGPVFGEGPNVRHPHNLFVSQWLQTGAVGVALFTLMICAVGARYVAFVRSGDEALARLGAIGCAVLASFVIRNLTDDFFLRANGRILFAVNALLLAGGALRMRELLPARATPP
jgi:O-antigen ligase